MPPRHLPGRHRNAESGAAKEVQRQGRERGQLLHFPGGRCTRAPGEDRRAFTRRTGWSHRPAGNERSDQALEEQGPRLQQDAGEAPGRARGRDALRRQAGPRHRQGA